MENNLINKELEKYYQEFSGQIFGYLLKKADEGTAMDILQETFLAFFEILHKRKKILNAKAYLFQIARNKIIQNYKDQKLMSAAELKEIGNPGEVEKNVLGKEIREIIYKSYRIVYKIVEDMIFVVLVVHGSRDLEALLQFDIG